MDSIINAAPERVRVTRSNTDSVNVGVVVPAFAPGATQTVVIGASYQQSTAIGATVVRLYSTVLCHIAIGADPTATAAGMPLPAGVAEYFTCNATDQVAVIQDSAGGTLYVTAGA